MLYAKSYRLHVTCSRCNKPTIVYVFWHMRNTPGIDKGRLCGRCKQKRKAK